jgi:hypothetical protein
MLLSSGNAWHRLKWIGETKRRKICFEELPGEMPHKKARYFCSVILKMPSDDVVFSNISTAWFTEYIHIRRCYTELKKYTSKGGNLTRQNIVNWIKISCPYGDIFAILNGIFVTENFGLVISNMHVHVCKTVLKVHSQASSLLLVQCGSNECCSIVVSNFASFLIGPEFHSQFAGSYHV